jgi:hypothetical protein
MELAITVRMRDINAAMRGLGATMTQEEGQALTGTDGAHDMACDTHAKAEDDSETMRTDDFVRKKKQKVQDGRCGHQESNDAHQWMGEVPSKEHIERAMKLAAKGRRF